MSILRFFLYIILRFLKTGVYMEQQNPMKTHVTIIGAVYILFSVLGLLSAFFLS